MGSSISKNGMVASVGRFPAATASSAHDRKGQKNAKMIKPALKAERHVDVVVIDGDRIGAICRCNHSDLVCHSQRHSVLWEGRTADLTGIELGMV